MTAGEDSFDGVGGPRGLFPTDLPWTPQAGFVVDRPPAQIDDAWVLLATAESEAKTTDENGATFVLSSLPQLGS